ncbi:hypothetical protein HC031_11350 [Planosporangium thailandense]|uniref:Uncharacterized protein n=1 Tax=Planosporangium thailandense TaxID=765197 RepID=A0ABX0XWU4_9ACTN|nr:hypothetical protein [Planosporangium thailandense]NJC70301.1 hypothetical protein [Planosporangium thailandense]
MGGRQFARAAAPAAEAFEVPAFEVPAVDVPVVAGGCVAGADVLEPDDEVDDDGSVGAEVDDEVVGAGAGSAVRDSCVAGGFGWVGGLRAGTRCRVAAPGCGAAPASAAGASDGDGDGDGTADGLADGSDDWAAETVGIGSPTKVLSGSGLGESVAVSGPDIAAAAGMKPAAAPPPANSTPAVVTVTRSARRLGLRCLPTGMSIPPKARTVPACDRGLPHVTAGGS